MARPALARRPHLENRGGQRFGRQAKGLTPSVNNLTLSVTQ